MEKKKISLLFLCLAIGCWIMVGGVNDEDQLKSCSKAGSYQPLSSFMVPTSQNESEDILPLNCVSEDLVDLDWTFDDDNFEEDPAREANLDTPPPIDDIEVLISSNGFDNPVTQSSSQDSPIITFLPSADVFNNSALPDTMEKDEQHKNIPKEKDNEESLPLHCESYPEKRAIESNNVAGKKRKRTAKAKEYSEPTPSSKTARREHNVKESETEGHLALSSCSNCKELKKENEEFKKENEEFKKENEEFKKENERLKAAFTQFNGLFNAPLLSLAPTVRTTESKNSSSDVVDTTPPVSHFEGVTGKQELSPGSGVFIPIIKLHECNHKAGSDLNILLRDLIDHFFSEETLAESVAFGRNRVPPTREKVLDPKIVSAIRGYLSAYAKKLNLAPLESSKFNKMFTNKCTQAKIRRKKKN